jgi:hypothetical protein
MVWFFPVKVRSGLWLFCGPMDQTFKHYEHSLIDIIILINVIYYAAQNE